MARVVQQPTRETLQGDLGRLLRAPQGETRLRDMTLLCFAISTGATCTEIAQVQLSDLFFDTPAVDLDASHSDHGGYIHLRAQNKISVFDTCAGLLLKSYLRSVGRVPGQRGSIFNMTGNAIQRITGSLSQRAQVCSVRCLQVRRKLPCAVTARDKAGILQDLRRQPSPLLTLQWDWSQWPVHLPVEAVIPDSFF